MAATTSIEWTATVNADGTVTPGKTWNPTRGCSIVSPGCINCYAMRQGHRQSAAGRAYHGLTKSTSAGPQWTGAVRTVDAALLEPLSWRKPSKVFVNSMSDLFHEDVPDDFIDRVMLTIVRSYYHTFQVLTKRPERMRRYFSDPGLRGRIDRIGLINNPTIGARGKIPPTLIRQWPLPTLWLGVSVENQHFADERIPLLLQTPAAVRFISAEPLLGPVDLTRIFVREGLTGWGPRTRHVNALNGWESDTPRGTQHAREHQATGRALDWVIVGGESGPGARPFDVAWARSIVAQCKAAGVPVFCKQMGRRPIDNGSPLVFADRKGGTPEQWPAGDWPREFPHA